MTIQGNTALAESGQISQFARLTVSMLYEGVKQTKCNLGPHDGDYKIRQYLEEQCRIIFANFMTDLTIHPAVGRCLLMNRSNDQMQASVEFVLDKLIRPIAEQGEKNAIDLLIYFCAYLDGDIRKSARKTLALAGQSPAAKETTVSKLNFNHPGPCRKTHPTLLQVLWEIDNEAGIKAAMEDIAGFLNSGVEARAIAMDLVAPLNLERHHYEKAFLMHFRFWETELAGHWQHRENYYKLVGKAFKTRAIKARELAKLIRPAYKFEGDKDRLSEINELIRLTGLKRADDIIMLGILYAACSKDNKVFRKIETLNCLLADLTEAQKMKFHSLALAKADDEEVINLSVRYLLMCGRSDQILDAIASALRKSNHPKTICWALLGTANDHVYFKEEHKHWDSDGRAQLVRLATDWMKDCTDIAKAAAMVKQFAFEAADLEFQAAFDKACWLLHNGDEKTFHEALLLIWVMRSRSVGCRPYFDSGLNAHMAELGPRILAEIYETVKNGTSYGVESLPIQALEYLDAINHDASIPELARLMNEEKKIHSNCKEAIAIFLASRAKIGKIDALNLLSANAGENINSWIVPEMLAKVYQETFEPEVREKTAQCIADRLLRSVTDPTDFQRLEYISEMKAVVVCHLEPCIQSALLETIRLIPKIKFPSAGLGGQIIKKLPELLAPESHAQAKDTLFNAIKSFGTAIEAQDKESRFPRNENSASAANSIMLDMIQIYHEL